MERERDVAQAQAQELWGKGGKIGVEVQRLQAHIQAMQDERDRAIVQVLRMGVEIGQRRLA